MTAGRDREKPNGDDPPPRFRNIDPNWFGDPIQAAVEKWIGQPILDRLNKPSKKEQRRGNESPCRRVFWRRRSAGE